MSTPIVIVGQTPPPYGGQAIMIQKLLAHEYDGIKLLHVRMNFSKEMDQIGKLHIQKIWELIQVILRIVYVRLKYRALILYYPPAGPERIPIWRDILILTATRWMFQKTIFHFHAGGLTDQFEKLSRIERYLFRRAYAKPDAIIRMSKLVPAKVEILEAKQDYIIPYGVDDEYSTELRPLTESRATTKLLFVGVLRESKGVMILLHAYKILCEKNIPLQLNIVGKFESLAFEEHVRHFVDTNGLTAKVNFLGVLTGKPKQQIFTQSDIFCFPTFFESEAFSVVLIEALSFALPVVSTNWRGIPDIIPHGVCGYLTPTQNAALFAQAVELLILNPALRQKMGQESRKRYLAKYTVQQYHHNLQAMFTGLDQASTPALNRKSTIVT